jgi:hypothetical protein
MNIYRLKIWKHVTVWVDDLTSTAQLVGEADTPRLHVLTEKLLEVRGNLGTSRALSFPRRDFLCSDVYPSCPLPVCAIPKLTAWCCELENLHELVAPRQSSQFWYCAVWVCALLVVVLYFSFCCDLGSIDNWVSCAPTFQFLLLDCLNL